MKKYFAFFHLAALTASKNTNAYIGLSIFLLACLLVFFHIWEIAVPEEYTKPFTTQQLLWYIAFNEWILLSLPTIQFDMEQDLRSGKFDYQLPRPVSYLGATFAEASGKLFVNLVILGTVAFLFTWMKVGIISFSLLNWSLLLLLSIFAAAAALLFQMLIGLSAFWLREVSPLSWIWEKFLFVFGGLLLPLSIYPIWMEKIADWLPFSAILGSRSAAFITHNSHLIWGNGIALLIWSFVGILGLVIVYRRCLQILERGGT